jgi:metal-sulfur cluster biosynthetic enzyme
MLLKTHLPSLTFIVQGQNLAELENKVRSEIEKIIDPETGLTFGQMGLINSVKEQEPGVVKIDFVPTSPYCPIAFKFALDIKATAKKVEGIKKALVYVHGHKMEQNINQMVNKTE